MTDFVHAPPVTTAGALQPIDSLVEIVAQAAGGSGDPEIRSLALVCLDRAADKMNMSGIFAFRQKDATYTTSDGSLTNGQSSLALPADWAWPLRNPALYLASALVGQVEWTSFDRFREFWSDLDTSDTSNYGTPAYLSIRSEIEELAYLWPFVSTADVDTIVVPYYARIQRLSEITDTQVYLTPEAREALVAGGEAYMLRHVHMHEPQIWQPVWQQFLNTITQAKGASKRRNSASLASWAQPLI